MTHLSWSVKTGAAYKTHLISLSHVAVQDPSHALDGRMLQLMGPSHIIINAPCEEGEHMTGSSEWVNM